MLLQILLHSFCQAQEVIEDGSKHVLTLEDLNILLYTIETNRDFKLQFTIENKRNIRTIASLFAFFKVSETLAVNKGLAPHVCLHRLLSTIFTEMYCCDTENEEYVSLLSTY